MKSKWGLVLGLTVFISHANHIDDLPLVDNIANWLKLIGVTPILAKDAYEPSYVAEKIGRMIDESYGVVVVYTEHAQQSGFVQQEIGYAHKAGKKIVILKTLGSKLTGFSYGYDTIDLDAEDLPKELAKLEKALEVPKETGGFWDVLLGVAAIAVAAGLIIMAVRSK